MVDGGLLAFNFTLGVLAFFSPCGFPMLPAFIAYYLSGDATARGAATGRTTRGLARGLGGGALAALGALAVLAAVAALAVAIGAPFKARVLLLELVGGLVVIALGVATLAGRDVSFTPRVTATPRKGPVGLLVFGALYAGASAGCVAPAFITVVYQAISAPTVAEGALYVGAYAAGFTLLLLSVTVAVALAGAGLVRRLNVVLPYVKPVAGVVLVAVGLYLVWYWADIEYCVTRGEEHLWCRDR